MIVSGDKDFQQLVRPGIWLLNPGRGGPASVEEQWVSVENGAERLGVEPKHVTDYLALVGDSSDNVPGVKGIGEKTARDLVIEFGDLEAILAAAPSLTKKRPREALLEQGDLARLSKELVTIREDLPAHAGTRCHARSRARFGAPAAAVRRARIPFTRALDRRCRGRCSVAAAPPLGTPEATPEATRPTTHYVTVDTIPALERMVARARKAPYIAVDTETVIEPDSPQEVDPLRSILVAISIAVGPGEAFYLPLRHRVPQPVQGDLLLDARRRARARERCGYRQTRRTPKQPRDQASQARPIARAIEHRRASTRGGRSAGRRIFRRSTTLDGAASRAARGSGRSQGRRRTRSTISSSCVVLGITLSGLVSDTMVASYVLDPGRRSHGLDLLALEFLDHTMTSYEDLCGKGKAGGAVRRRARSHARETTRARMRT